MHRLITAPLLVLAIPMLVACHSLTVEDYADRRPALVPEAFFDGELTAHGVVMDRGGRVIRMFNAVIEAYWKDGIGTLEEDFVFDDGETDRRVWILTPRGAGRYTGRAHDVVGDGSITVSGNSMFLDYVLRIPYGEGTIDVHIDDRMYLVQSNVLINESMMSKFGVDVGRILLVIQKRPPPAG